MSQAEVQALSNKDLIQEWKMVVSAYRNGLPKHLSYLQSNILFANFVNISTEMNKRNLDTKVD